MKKNVKVLGISHKVGKRRDGKEFDIHILHGSYDDEDTVGSAVISGVVPAVDLPLCKVGAEIVVVSHFMGGREYIDAVYLMP